MTGVLMKEGNLDAESEVRQPYKETVGECIDVEVRMMRL